MLEPVTHCLLYCMCFSRSQVVWVLIVVVILAPWQPWPLAESFADVNLTVIWSLAESFADVKLTVILHSRTYHVGHRNWDAIHIRTSQVYQGADQMSQWLEKTWTEWPSFSKGVDYMFYPKTEIKMADQTRKVIINPWNFRAFENGFPWIQVDVPGTGSQEHLCNLRLEEPLWLSPDRRMAVRRAAMSKAPWGAGALYWERGASYWESHHGNAETSLVEMHSTSRVSWKRIMN